MIAIVAAFGTGLLFGLGLTLAQMIAPGKVIGFLDIFGAWDASLAFVMAGAIPVAAAGFAIARRRSAPLFAPAFRWPDRADFDVRTATGAALFGIGWGLSGYCPGPAVATLGLGHPQTWLFVAAMIVGMAAFELFMRQAERKTTASSV